VRLKWFVMHLVLTSILYYPHWSHSTIDPTVTATDYTSHSQLEGVASPHLASALSGHPSPSTLALQAVSSDHVEPSGGRASDPSKPAQASKPLLSASDGPNSQNSMQIDNTDVAEGALPSGKDNCGTTSTSMVEGVNTVSRASGESSIAGKWFDRCILD
jgi:hypothetical protein